MRVARSVLLISNKGQRDARKALAIIEGLRADARHAVGDRDARKALAITEGTLADARHARGDCDARKA